MNFSTLRLRLVMVPSTGSIVSSLNARFCSSAWCDAAWRSGLPQSSQSPARTALQRRLRAHAVEDRLHLGRAAGLPRRRPPRLGRSRREHLRVGKAVDADQRVERPLQLGLLVAQRGHGARRRPSRRCTSGTTLRPGSPARRTTAAASTRRVGELEVRVAQHHQRPRRAHRTREVGDRLAQPALPSRA